MKRKRKKDELYKPKKKMSKLDIDNLTLSFNQIGIVNQKIKEAKLLLDQQKKNFENNKLILKKLDSKISKKEENLIHQINLFNIEKKKLKQQKEEFKKEKDKFEEKKHHIEWLIETGINNKIAELENRWFSNRPVPSFYS